MALTAADSIRLKAHCCCYKSLSHRSQELDHLLVGHPIVPRIDISGRLHTVLRDLKSDANYELFPEAVASVLRGLRLQRGYLYSTLREQPPELVDGVMTIYDAIIQDVENVAQGEDAWDHLPFFDSCQTTAREMAGEFYAGTQAQPAQESVRLEFEWYEKGFHQRTAPAGWRADDRCLVLRFDFMHFTYQDYLCIPFLLFHEYVSHVYDLPVFGCKLKNLILDGWLLGAQHEFFEAKWRKRAYELRREQLIAVHDHLSEGLRKGTPAHRGYHLARSFYNDIEDADVATNMARDLVLRRCGHMGTECFHLDFLRKIHNYYRQGRESSDELRRKVKASPSVEDLLTAL